jgi:hypothetical protein
MSCGCQDKENDAKIIEEIQRRKTMNEITELYYYEDFRFDGLLRMGLDFIDESEIVSIDRFEHLWVFHLKKRINN